MKKVILVLLACLMLLAMPPFSASAVNLPAPGTVTSWGDNSFSPVLINFPAGVTPISISAFETDGGLAITSDGSLYSWTGVANAAPTKVTFPSPVTTVYAASMRYSVALALTNDGLYAWGANDKGQLGDGTTVSRYTPGKVLFPASVTSVTAIAAGYLHSLAMTNDGLYAWGDNWNGEIGDGTRINRSLPVKVALPSTVTTVTQVAAGRNSSYANTNDGVYAWGSDFAGQLGDGSYGILPDGSSDVGKTLPVKVLLSNKGKITSITDIAAGEYYALAITNDGLYAWGMNVGGALGVGSKVDKTALPMKVTFPKAVTTIKQIAASTNHSAAVTNDGLYAWGINSIGQAGFSSNTYLQSTPTKIHGEDNAIDIAVAEYSSIAIH